MTSASAAASGPSAAPSSAAWPAAPSGRSSARSRAARPPPARWTLWTSTTTITRRTAHGTDTANTGTTGYADTTADGGLCGHETAAPAGTYADTGYDTDTTRADGTQRVQLRDEELRADTQQVAAGEVHIHKDIITENKSIDVPVTREEVVIERHPVNAAYAGTADFNQADQEIRIPVMEEQVTLAKNTVVREEVEVGKRAVTETQHLTGTVQHEELRVEDSTGNVVSDTTNPR